MAAKIEKPENAATEPPIATKELDPRDELKLTRADLVELKKKFNVLNTNYKRAQSKIAKLDTATISKDVATIPKDEAPAAPGPLVNASPPQAAASTAPSHLDHEMEWVPPFCGEHGCKNDLFKDEVVCANCNGPIGSEKYAKHQLQACPLCGKNAGYKPRPEYKLQHNGCTGPECRVK